MKPTLLIDGDEYLFKACAAVEREVRWDEWNHVLYANENEAWDNFQRLVAQLFERFDTSDHLMCFSGAQPYFRSALAADYKGGRSGRKPICYAMLRERCDDHYKIVSFPHLEADDVMGILSTQPSKHGEYFATCRRTIISQDKDMLCVPGLLSRDGRAVQTVTEKEANYFHLLQTLVGDRTDNFAGCPGVGPVKAEKILHVEPSWASVVKAYVKAGLTEEHALTQARLARILRWSDWDAEKKEPILWAP